MDIEAGLTRTKSLDYEESGQISSEPTMDQDEQAKTKDEKMRPNEEELKKATSENDISITTKSAELASMREENVAKKRILFAESSISTMPSLDEEDVDQDKKPSAESGAKSNSTKTTKSVKLSICPSLTDTFLSKWGVKRDPGEPLEFTKHMTEKEIEDSYTNVVLAIKTDRQTLDQRVHLQQRAKETTEGNVQNELKDLKAAMLALEPMCNEMKSREHFLAVKKHVSILEVSSDRLITRSEALGASKQEYRLSRAVDIIVKHVDNLNRKHELERDELNATRRLLEDNRSGQNDKRFPNSPTTPGGKVGRRRASMSVVKTSPALHDLNQANLHALFNKQSQAKDDAGVSYEDPKSPLKQFIDSTASNISSVIRRASLATSSSSPFSLLRPSSTGDNNSTFEHTAPSFRNYRNNYDRMNSVSSMSSTSSDDSMFARSPSSGNLMSTALPELPEDGSTDTNNAPLECDSSTNLLDSVNETQDVFILSAEMHAAKLSITDDELKNTKNATPSIIQKDGDTTCNNIDTKTKNLTYICTNEKNKDATIIDTTNIDTKTKNLTYICTDEKNKNATNINTDKCTVNDKVNIDKTDTDLANNNNTDINCRVTSNMETNAKDLTRNNTAKNNATFTINRLVIKGKDNAVGDSPEFNNNSITDKVEVAQTNSDKSNDINYNRIADPFRRRSQNYTVEQSPTSAGSFHSIQGEEAENLHQGLTDDSKLIMTKASSQSQGLVRRRYSDKVKARTETQDTIQNKSVKQRVPLKKRLQRMLPDWNEFKIRLRYTFAGMVFVLGIICLIMTFIPKSNASERQLYQRHSWTSLEEILWPFVSLNRNGPPPF